MFFSNKLDLKLMHGGTLYTNNLLCWRIVQTFILDRPSCSKSKMRGKKQILQFAAKKNPGLRGLLRVGDDILT